jgi:hypothetical protein
MKSVARVVCIVAGLLCVHGLDANASGQTLRIRPADRAELILPAQFADDSFDIGDGVAFGQRSHWLAGAAIGFVAGAGTTYLVLHSGGSTSLCDRSSNQDAMSSTECAALTVLGGIVGAGIGALAGSRFQSEQRHHVRPSDFRVQPARDGGVELSLLLRRR